MVYTSKTVLQSKLASTLQGTVVKPERQIRRRAMGSKEAQENTLITFRVFAVEA